MPRNKQRCHRRDACFRPYRLRHNLTTLPDIAPRPWIGACRRSHFVLTGQTPARHRDGINPTLTHMRLQPANEYSQPMGTGETSHRNQRLYVVQTSLPLVWPFPYCPTKLVDLPRINPLGCDYVDAGSLLGVTTNLIHRRKCPCATQTTVLRSHGFQP